MELTASEIMIIKFSLKERVAELEKRIETFKDMVENEEDAAEVEFAKKALTGTEYELANTIELLEKVASA